jgi:uncharacterized phage-associated protein
MIDIQKEKLANAILYFVKNTKNCGKTKLFKLLYFLDFLHFKRYGTTVTGLDYYTWPKGPVPQKLYSEFAEEDGSEIYKDFFKIIRKTDPDDPKQFYSFRFIPKAQFNHKIFSPRELKIMEEVAFQFKNSSASEISEISHLKNKPWYKTKESKGMKKLIDYELAIDEDSTLTKEEIMERYNIERELKNFV